MRKAMTFASSMLAVAVLIPASALAKTNGTEQPLQVSVSATSVVNLERFTNHYAGTDIASHAGKGTIDGNGSFTFSGFNTLAYHDEWVFTVPSGDKVSGTSTGTITGGPEGLLNSSETVVVQTITGGTGRFANASGTVIGKYHLVLVSSEGPFFTYSDQGSARGSISY